MNLHLKFFATYREAVGGKTVDREVEEGATVGEVLAGLEADYGIELLEDGDVRPQINVLRNGRDVTHQEGIDTVLEADDELSIFPPVAGG
jgi:molybdopterin synthase sulfur carrier subunit